MINEGRTKAWGHDAQALGNRCPKGGDTMPKAWATLLNAVSYCGLVLG